MSRHGHDQDNLGVMVMGHGQLFLGKTGKIQTTKRKIPKIPKITSEERMTATTHAGC